MAIDWASAASPEIGYRSAKTDYSAMAVAGVGEAPFRWQTVIVLLRWAPTALLKGTATWAANTRDCNSNQICGSDPLQGSDGPRA